MLVVFGLNKDIWNQLGAAERAQYNWASRLYLLSCVLSAAAGVRFMHQLADSYAIGVLGGLLVGYIVSVVTRIALITMVSLPLLPEQAPAAASIVANSLATQPSMTTYASKLISFRKQLPDFSIVFRLLIIALMSIVVALPVASLIGYTEAENISAQRRSEVISEFKANHPDMSSEQNRILIANLQADYFPIHVYQRMAQLPLGIFSLWATGACFLIPFFMLWHLRRGSQFQYAKLNRDMLVHQIETDYSMTLEQSRRIQQNRFGLNECILPHQTWLDAPFNSRSISEQNQYTSETEAEFLERLKTL